MAGGRIWTAEEDDYLSEAWGYVSMPTICKKLNRTKTAVRIRKNRLGLVAYYNSGEYVTLNQLMLAIRGVEASSCTVTSYVKNRGMPVFTKKIDKKRVRCIRLADFWKWAEQHRTFIDFAKFEPLALGPEPAWVEEKRAHDRTANANKYAKWTSTEDARLKALLALHKYTVADMSKLLARGEHAIIHRIEKLKIKDRPVCKDPHEGRWTEQHNNILVAGIKSGASYEEIGQKIGKAAKSVQGHVHYLYLTQDLDRVRTMIGDGQWGDNLPEIYVRDGVTHSRSRRTVRRDLSKLAGLLAYRAQTMPEDPYWQKGMCALWSGGKCTAGEANCDECTSFKRIKPQYCARCGSEFMDKKTQELCPVCRKKGDKNYGR